MEQVMTKLDIREFKTEEPPVATQTPVTTPEAPAAPPLPEPLRGDPAMVALPTVIAGAVGLFLTTIGLFPRLPVLRRSRSFLQRRCSDC